MAHRRYGRKAWQEAWVECVGLGGSQIDHRNNMPEFTVKQRAESSPNLQIS